MPEADRILGMYLHLARASQLRRRPMIGDKLLVLAGVQAEEMGLGPISALCRQRVLAHNAHHLVGQWPTLTDALVDDEFQSYLKQLKRRYSREKIEHMLHSLGIELGRERDAYFTDLEYAAALLDTNPQAIDGLLARAPLAPANGANQHQNPGTGDKHRPSDARPGSASRSIALWILAAAILSGLVGLIAVVLLG